MQFKKVISKSQSEDTGLSIADSTDTKSASAPASAPAKSAPSSASSSAGGGTNKLSSDVEIKGKVRFQDGLIVDGKIDGEIESNGALTVQKNAHIKAQIRTKSIIIEGKVHGNITVAEHARIAKSAEVVGDVKAKTLEIETGATFVGKSAVGTPSISASVADSSKTKQKVAV